MPPGKQRPVGLPLKGAGRRVALLTQENDPWPSQSALRSAPFRGNAIRDNLIRGSLQPMKITAVRAPFPSTKWHSILLMLVVVTIFASTDALAKYLSHRYPVPGIVWVRYAVQTLFMLAVWGPRLGWGLMRT